MKETEGLEPSLSVVKTGAVLLAGKMAMTRRMLLRVKEAAGD